MWSLAMHEVVSERQAALRRDARRQHRESVLRAPAARLVRRWRAQATKTRS